MDGQNIAREAREEARRAVEQGRRIAEEEIRTSFPGLSEGMPSTMSQEEIDMMEQERREEMEDAAADGGEPVVWHNPDID